MPITPVNKPSDTTTPLERQRLARDEVDLALEAWEWASACGLSRDEAGARGLRWLRASWGAGADFLPLTFVLDFGFLLLLGRAFPFRALPDSSSQQHSLWATDAEANDAERHAGAEGEPPLNENGDESVAPEISALSPEYEREFLLAYQDRVVSLWAQDSAVRDLHVHIAGLDEAAQDVLISHAVRLALGPPLEGIDSLVVGNPAHLRTRVSAASNVPSSSNANADTANTPAMGGLNSDPPASAPDAAWRHWVCTSLGPAIAVLANTPHLISPEDAWEIVHLDALPRESTRLALRQIHRAAAAVGPLAAGGALSIRQRAREVPLEDSDADHYPTGGFDAVATQGNFENLVRSEIAYVGEGTDGLEGIDLFDIRFAEGELLFYTRDESPVLDAFRTLTIIVDEPARLRQKHPALSAQTGVLIFGMVLALQADMLRAFGASASSTQIWLMPHLDDDGPDAKVAVAATEGEAAAEEDRAVLAVSLRSELLHRRATVEVAPLKSDGRIPRSAVVFSLRARPSRTDALAWIRVDGPVWTWEERQHNDRSRDDRTWDARDNDALRALADEILLAVASGGKRRS